MEREREREREREKLLLLHPTSSFFSKQELKDENYYVCQVLSFILHMLCVLRRLFYIKCTNVA